jgi:hypothetical protein
MQYALLAAFTTAIWYELINFGPRALIELIAGCFYQPFISVLCNKIKGRKASGDYFSSGCFWV